MDDLVRDYGAGELEEALERAKSYGAKHPLAYAEESLRKLYGERREAAGRKGAAPPEPVMLWCEGDCGLSVFLNSMVIREGRAMCSECGGRRRSYVHDDTAPRHVHVLGYDEEYEPTGEDLAARPDDLDRAEVVHLHRSQLLWWARQPSCYRYPAVRDLVVARLLEVGVGEDDIPPAPDRPALTESARYVLAHRQRVLKEAPA